MTTQASAKLKITGGNQISFADPSVVDLETPKLTRGSFVSAYQGDLEGNEVLEELKCYTTPTTAKVYGLARFTGRLGDKSGSFVFEKIGQFEDGVLISTWTVVPDSGTGDLKNLRGKVDFKSGSVEEFPVIFDYYFE
jgi:hypothetical protein